MNWNSAAAKRDRRAHLRYGSLRKLGPREWGQLEQLEDRTRCSPSIAFPDALSC